MWKRNVLHTFFFNFYSRYFLQLFHSYKWVFWNKIETPFLFRISFYMYVASKYNTTDIEYLWWWCTNVESHRKRSFVPLHIKANEYNAIHCHTNEWREQYETKQTASGKGSVSRYNPHFLSFLFLLNFCCWSHHCTI